MGTPDEFEPYEHGLTYVIRMATDGNGQQSITCNLCNMTSLNPDDVRNRYCGHCHAGHHDMQSIIYYVVYDHPRDFPDKWVIRRHAHVFHPSFDKPRLMIEAFGFSADTREAIEQMVPAHATHIGRMPGDDPKIADVWII